jgi:hypothetical protein
MTLKVQVERGRHVFRALPPDARETAKNRIGGIFLRYQIGDTVVDALSDAGQSDAAAELLEALKMMGESK